MPDKMALFKDLTPSISSTSKEDTLHIQVADELFSAGGLGNGGKCPENGVC